MANRNKSILLVALGLGLSIVVLWRGPTKGKPAKQLRSVVLISIDTCRPDHLSCYGYGRNTTPNIDAVAAKGVRFEMVIAPTPLTLPSHASMLTGTIPPAHGVHGNGTYRLAQANITLAERLKEEGYATGAVVGAFVLDPQFGLDQGFDFYDATFRRDNTRDQMFSTRRADDVNDVAESWIKERTGDEPFFLFVHYYDAHYPYEPPEPFASTYSDAPYAGEIAYVDSQIGNLLAVLRSIPSARDAIVIITSDHGEALGGHGENSHGYFAYHDTTLVPLILQGPGIDAGRVVNEKVALVDIVPTVCSLLGIEPPGDIQGRSLLLHVSGATPKPSKRLIYSESMMPAIYDCNPLFAVETQLWKYIHTTKPELYDLIEDPAEANNLFAQRKPLARTMFTAIRRLLGPRMRRHANDALAFPDREAIERLETLGYLSGSSNVAVNLDSKQEDPKDFLHFYTGLNMASDLANRDPNTPIEFPGQNGQPVQVLPRKAARIICEQITQVRPDIKKAWGILARLASDEGDLAGTRANLTALLKLDPQSPSALHDLGVTLVRMNELEEAADLFMKALRRTDLPNTGPGASEAMLERMGRIDPARFEAQVGLANVRFRQGRFENAIAQYRSVLEMNPLATGPSSHHETTVLAYYRIGVSCVQLGRLDDAAAAFREVLARNPDHSKAREAIERLEGDD